MMITICERRPGKGGSAFAIIKNQERLYPYVFFDTLLLATRRSDFGSSYRFPNKEVTDRFSILLPGELT